MSYYTWRGQNIVPTRPATVCYDRYDCEPDPFDKLRLDILTAASKGQRYAFRVRPMREVNDWRAPAAWPRDWNSLVFLDFYREFVGDLAEFLDAANLTQHLAWVEIAYGSWGEGADCADYKDRTLIHLVDTYLQAFPNTRLLIPAKTRPLAVYHFLAQRHRSFDMVGVRIDNFGCLDDYFTDILLYCNGLFCAGEFRNPTKMLAEGGDYERAARQVKEWGATIGNGNLPEWSTLTVEQQCALLEIGIG